MIIYLFLGLLCLNAYCNYKNGQKKISIYIVYLLILFVGLQNHFTSDYSSYSNHFNEINGIYNVLTSIYEIGFDFLILFTKKLNLGFQTLLIIIASISILVKYYVIDKLSPWPSISFIIYFIYFFIYNDLSQIRHGLAIAICFLAILYINKKTYISFLLILLASTFHTSALFFIPIVFIDKIPINKKTILIFLSIICCVSLINIYDLINILNNTFLHSSYISFKLNSYGMTSTIPFLQFGFWFRIIFALYYAKNCIDIKDRNQVRIFKIFLLGILMYCLTSSIGILQARVSVYYMYMILPMMGNLFEKIYINKNKKDIIFFMIIIIYLIVKFILLINNNYFIYQSI